MQTWLDVLLFQFLKNYQNIMIMYLFQQGIILTE